MNIDRILRMATLVALLIIIYILLPVRSRYEYKINNGGYGRVFLSEPGLEPVALNGNSMLMRRRKW